MAHLVFFDPAILALQEELRYHPDLMEQLSQDPSDEFELRLGRIAAYCEIGIDGWFTDKELVNLCSLCTAVLQSKRAEYIN